MKSKTNIPHAPVLMNSLRSLGYTFESAIADLVDNSIGAGSQNINIELNTIEEPYIIISDDGHGMDEEELFEAMRYGSTDPDDDRKDSDLGRFGLGMKSASLSQCRKLTVASKKNGKISCCGWDIDHVIDKQEWSVLMYDQCEIRRLPEIDRISELAHGTFLLLQNFDRISESTGDLTQTLKVQMDRTIDHLALVFHRFTEKGIVISVNGSPIPARDPFLRKHKATINLREQKIKIEKSVITVKPYVLPHLTKIKQKDIELVGSKENLKENQGFYVYRNERLIIWGTWFRLYKKNELGKLARVMVDIPNTLDSMWSLDIKKSKARLPDIIKQQLHASVLSSMEKSDQVFSYRGRKDKKENDFNYVWERMTLRENEYRYEINRNLPQLKILAEILGKKELQLLNQVLDLIEDTLPLQALYLDSANGKLTEYTPDEIELIDSIKLNLKQAESIGLNKSGLIEGFYTTAPYCLSSKVKEFLKGEKNHE
ncbi:ATP-binding protein [Eubacterium barkeri]|uniref:Histidine kinase-, DNA gyrase B-, and HSP90-like ATPase n=1 Tax=Eubacterium barkeri TaxID=1528 RepID=A0A1H3JU23_EUBBA|nr:ATP-binding protein [Eubacterium barkeri]SDY43403.1 Histidine kinase-, DNA gyrase B-, and HSP90-like ATPase [Eubacterium barkeri]